MDSRPSAAFSDQSGTADQREMSSGQATRGANERGMTRTLKVVGPFAVEQAAPDLGPVLAPEIVNERALLRRGLPDQRETGARSVERGGGRAVLAARSAGSRGGRTAFLRASEQMPGRLSAGIEQIKSYMVERRTAELPSCRSARERGSERRRRRKGVMAVGGQRRTRSSRRQGAPACFVQPCSAQSIDTSCRCSQGRQQQLLEFRVMLVCTRSGQT